MDYLYSIASAAPNAGRAERVEPSIRCALISTHVDWISPCTLACPGIDFTTLDIGLPNPFGLPLEGNPDVVLLEKCAYEWLVRHERVEPVLKALERWPLALLDGGDRFELSFPPQILERADVVLKGQGLFRDRDLYNYRVGPVYPGAVWSEKIRPREKRYREDDLEKLRLSVPCFAVDLPAVRRELRARNAGMERSMLRLERIARNVAESALYHILATARHRSRDVHAAFGLTHVQRLDVVRALDGLSGTRGIIERDEPVLGTEYGRALPPDVRRAFVTAAKPYLLPRVGRVRYLRDLRRHRVVVAPCGYGELTFRHGEAWRAGAALVCQDLSHVETLLSIRSPENAVFCRSDLSDIRSVVIALLMQEDERERVAAEGLRKYAAWAADWENQLQLGIGMPLRELTLCSVSSPMG